VDQSHKRKSLYSVLIIAVLCGLAAAGCAKPTPIILRYIPDPADHVAAGRFFPAKIAVAIAQSPGVEPRVGVIADAAGNKLAVLQVVDIGGQTARVLAQALEEAGLKPVMIGPAPPDHQPPFGIDFLIMSGVNELRCDKRFLPGAPADVFRLNASVDLKVELVNRGGILAVTEGSSSMDEPPFGTNLATYHPEVTDPATALSRVMSRAVRSALAQPTFVEALPQHKLPAPDQP
jgi:hypothetical protein